MTTWRQHLALAGAPALAVCAGEPAAARGTVLHYHGLSAAKEANAKELDSLAAAGFLAVGVDNVGHGERRYPDFDARFGGGNQARWQEEFLRAVEATAAEVPAIVDALLARGWAPPGGIGLCGISMGGCVVYAAALAERRLGAAVAILGTPRWQLPWPSSPHLRPADYFPLPLLSQNAGADEHVPPGYARQLHADLQPHYAAAPERQRYVEHPGAGHFMPEEDWERLWALTLDWFGRYLGTRS